MTRRPAAFALAALLAGCSPGADPPVSDNGQSTAASANGMEAAPPAPSARLPAKVAAADPPKVPAAGAGQRRCGWLVNPTPGNWWLDDRDGEWILATQGSEPAPGMDDMPDMTTAGWVETNGHYGHGCACMTIAYDPETKRVTRVADASPRPLKQCRADKSLPRPE